MGRALRIFVAVGVAGVGAAEAAPRPSVNAEVFAGGGYDSNLFLQVAASPFSLNYHPYDGAFLRLAPAGDAALSGDSVRLELSYRADIRQTFGIGTLLQQDAELALTLPELGRASFRLAFTAGRFDASQYPADRFSAWGGEVEAGRRLSERLRAAVVYRFNRRYFGDPSQLQMADDLGQSAELRLTYLPRSTMEIGLGAAFLDLRSTLLDGTPTRLARVQAGLDGSYTPLPRLTVVAVAWVATQRDPGMETDRQVGGAGAILFRLGKIFDLMARYDVMFNWPIPGPSTFQSSYHRQVATLGVTGHFGATRRDRPTSSVGQNQSPEIQGTKVRFRLRAKGAGTVVVIGSWNDWLADVPDQRLRQTQDPELWEASIEIPAGQHRYHFLVDGKATRPVDAPQYRADDFGGENGVIETPP